MRCANHRPEVRRAHRVLQTAGPCGKRGSEEMIGTAGDCCHQQDSVAHEGHTIEGLSTKMHLILVNEYTTGEGACQKREDQRDGFRDSVEVMSLRMISLNPHA